MSLPQPTKIIQLKTADGETFDVSEAVAMELQTVKSFFTDNNDTVSADPTVVPLPNVSSKPLSKIIEFCKTQVGFAAISAPEDEKKKYRDGFVGELEKEELKELILAANYLNVKELLEVLNQRVADMIANKSVEFVREFFGIENDFTPEEEARLREENSWAFEGVDQD